MQYIKDYNEDLFNHINKLHEIKFRKHRELKKRWNKFKQLFFKKKQFIAIPQEHKDEIINTATAFMNISKEQFFDNVKKCYAARDAKTTRFSNQKQADEYWTNDINEVWLSLNINLQINDYCHVYSDLRYILKDNMSVCDYGCGSASLALTLNKIHNLKQLDLYDLKNYVSDFAKFAIKNDNLNNVNWYNVLEDNDKKYDVILCLDVLEHLENSYEILLKLHKKLNPGGLLVIKIAFESNDPSHLPQAAENFYFKNDGLKFMKDKFKLTKNFPEETLLINGIYRKKF